LGALFRSVFDVQSVPYSMFDVERSMFDVQKLIDFSLNNLIVCKISELTRILKIHKVRIAYLFGSRQIEGESYLSNSVSTLQEESDLDIGLVFNQLPGDRYKTYGKLYIDLDNLFEPFEVDLVFLQETDPLFQYEAINGRLIYAGDEAFLDNYEEYVMKLASDLTFKKTEFQKEIFEAVKNGYFEVAHR